MVSFAENVDAVTALGALDDPEYSDHTGVLQLMLQGNLQWKKVTLMCETIKSRDSIEFDEFDRELRAKQLHLF
jgi:hypothetical protein